jgi:hypothetical protein
MTEDTFHLIALHPLEPKVLVLEREGEWVLPSFEPQEGFFAMTGETNAVMLERYGIDTTVLRCVHHHDDKEQKRVEAVMLLEAHAVPQVLPPGARWVDAEGLSDMPGLTPEHQCLLRTCLEEDVAPDSVPALRTPWARRGWKTQAEDWVRTILHAHGWEPVGRLEQVKQWSITSLWRIPTERGLVYFKAVPPLFGKEPSITQALAQVFGNVPAPLQTDTERGWMLLPDFQGRTVGRAGEKALWPEAVRELARMQVASLSHREAFLDAGCADRRPAILLEHLPMLLHKVEELAPLTPDELAKLQAFEPRIREMIATLSAAGVPEALVHGDFHFGNVAVTEPGGRLVLFDWTDGCISHPLFRSGDPAVLRPRTGAVAGVAGGLLRPVAGTPAAGRSSEGARAGAAGRRSAPRDELHLHL